MVLTLFSTSAADVLDLCCHGTLLLLLLLHAHRVMYMCCHAGRAPLFQLMEEDYLARQAAEQEAKRAAYEAEVAAAKLATVSQLVSGEVVIKPPPGSISPGRSRSPGVCLCVCLQGGGCATAVGCRQAAQSGS